MNKPILIVGAPRSGTSITTRIIQDHIGPFPFEVTRHAEPVELVDIITRWLERNGLEFYDRLSFERIAAPDMELFEDLTLFFSLIKDQAVVVKEPAFSIIANWYGVNQMFNTIKVVRDGDSVVESLMYHKKFSREKAEQIVGFYFRYTCDANYTLEFEEKDWYVKQLKNIIEELGLNWDQDIFDKHWDEKQIEYYKK